MAQNSKDAQKRASRAERRAAEAAEMKARAEQMEKERRQQTLIGAIVMAVLVILVAIGAFTVYHNMHKNTDEGSTQTVEEAYDKLQQVGNTPKLVDKKGGLLISKDGYGKSVEGAPTVAIYMDFLCPGCGNLHRQLDEDLQKMVDAGQINLDLHFMAFMDKWSTDDYSSRAANAAIYLAEHDSDTSHLITFLEKKSTPRISSLRKARITSPSATIRSRNR